MRLWIVALVLFLGWPARADEVQTYYQRAAAGSHRQLPTASTYRAVYFSLCLGDQAPTDDEMSASVTREISILLAALAVDASALEGLGPSLDYPYLVASRLQAKLDPGLVWLAACHGLAASTGDDQTYFFPADEYDGLPSCFGPYSGPRMHPPYQQR
ncbi:MAG: hypothetical protein AB7S38_30485 [Vulcanimicrobiota bacterium]